MDEKFSSITDKYLPIFSGMALQSLMRTKNIETLNEEGCIDFLTGLAIEYGKVLCEKLDRLDVREFIGGTDFVKEYGEPQMGLG